MKLSDLDLDLRLPKPPMVLVAVIAIGAFVPMGLASAIWYKRNAFDPNPRIHIFQDMDDQAKKKAQASSDLFADGRAMRDYAPGAVAWGRSAGTPDPAMLKDDDLAYRGHEVSAEDGTTVFIDGPEGQPVPKYLDGYPETVTVDLAFIERGRQRFNINCFTCHGTDGRGLGPAKRAMDVLAQADAKAADAEKTGTVALVPANLTDVSKFGEGVYPNGRMYYTIAHGQGTMSAAPGQQLSVKDRWAVIAYVRAMQRSQQDQAPAE